ncbi:MAG: transcription termination factor NusA [Gemmatimonadetes bacterium]|nr:transcription termination factor NusA [Gemmatimonadota bacterium]
MTVNILDALGQITRERAISRDELLEMLKSGLVAGIKRKFGPEANADISVDPATGGIRIFLVKEVVEQVENPEAQISVDEASGLDLEGKEEVKVGDTVSSPDWEIEIGEFGRNAVQAVKQMIVQRVREEERNKVRAEYAHRVGELLSGTVQQVEKGNCLIFLNKQTEAILPAREQVRREHWRQGDTVRAVLIDIRETTKGPQLILSRVAPQFLKTLFQLEVPEILQGIVEIRALAREPGSRSKIAVYSRDDHVDPVGACVGLKGSRVQAVVSELAGERIDIVQWTDEPKAFIERALSPADVYRIVVQDEETVGEKAATVVVAPDQLSLAIGRSGQNVRLAAKLTGYRLDLISKEEYIAREKEILFGGKRDIFKPVPPAEDESARRADALAGVAEGATDGTGPASNGQPDTASELATRFSGGNFSLAEVPGIDSAMAEQLSGAGFRTFDDIIDLEEADILGVPGITPEAANVLMRLIEELTVEVDDEYDDAAGGGEDEGKANS